MDSLCFIEKVLVQQNAAKKLSSEIAMLINKPVQDVQAYLNTYCSTNNIVSRDQYQQKKITKSRKKVAEKPTKKANTNNASFSNEYKRMLKDKQLEASTLKTKVVDYSQKILVKIDSKTSIYVNPGDDIEAIKASFLKKNSQTLKERFSVKRKQKTCRKCCKEKPIEDFPKDKFSDDGYSNRCSYCSTKK